MSKREKKPKKVLLVSMPFAPLSPPSPQLSALEAYLVENSIPVESQHLYLKSANYLGLDSYTMISGAPDFPKEAVYSRFLFPQHFEKNKESIKIIAKQAEKELEKVSIESIIDRLGTFNDDIIKNISWQDYDLIGFTTSFAQLLPSLFITREIKNRYPGLKVVFGGFVVHGEAGIRVMKAFPYVDYIISGEGEKSLVALAKLQKDTEPDSIPGLIYRKNGKVVSNDRAEYLDMNSLPFYQMDSYFKQLENCSVDLRQYCEINLSIPIESSRGCWWGKCNFCNISSYHKKYRQKTIDRVVEEMSFQSQKYQLLSIYFLDEVLRANETGQFFDAIKGIGKDFILATTGRGHKLTKGDIEKMYDAGVAAHQIGVEAFSTNLLRKMEKGTKAIENIEIIKNCVEIGIMPLYTLIHSYPSQDKKDYEETVRNLKYLNGLPPPRQAFVYQLQYGSPIYNNCSKFNIREILPFGSKARHLLYPPEIAEVMMHWSYDFKRVSEEGTYLEEFKSTIEKWKSECEEKRKQMMGKPALFCNDGGNFLIIHDLREGHKKKFVLSDVERKLYLFCDRIRSLDEILEQFKDVSKEKITEILRTFDEHKLTFSEEDEYLSLAVKYRYHKIAKT